MLICYLYPNPIFIIYNKTYCFYTIYTGEKGRKLILFALTDKLEYFVERIRDIGFPYAYFADCIKESEELHKGFIFLEHNSCF